MTLGKGLFLQLFFAYNVWYTYCYFPSQIFLLTHYYFPKNMCSAQYGCCTYFLYVVLSRYLVRYFFNILEIVPGNLTIIIFKFHISCNPIVRSSYFKTFRLLSLTYISWNYHVYEKTSYILITPIVISDSMLRIVLRAFTSLFHSVVNLVSWLVSTNFCYMFISVFILSFYSHFLAHGEVLREKRRLRVFERGCSGEYLGLKVIK
jgi:hypothetical protein